MVPLEHLTEANITTRILEGEHPLYEIIVRRFNPCLYRIGRSYNYNHQDTQDLMQDTFIDAYRSLAQFAGRSDFKTWIIRIMMNNCYRKREKSSFKYEMAQDLNDNATPMFTTPDRDTGNVVRNHELGHIIEEALGRIPFDYRIVFSLREINGLKVSETAALLGISESNVKVRLNRSKAMLRSELEKAYSPQELFEFNLVYCDAVVDDVMKKINELD